jgi:predicted acylesterase/phospholipase RssA/CRP-like cAMP-binding protein
MSQQHGERGAGALEAVEAAAGADGMFAGLDADGRAAVEAEAEWTRLQSGDTLFREGDAGDALYVLIKGRLRVLVHGPAGDTLVAEIGRGETVGEMALLTGAPRSATVLAVRDSQLVRLSQAAFERIAQRCPGAMLLLTRRLVKRLQQTTRVPRAQASMVTIAVTSLDPALDAARVAETLVAALGAAAPTVLVTRASAETAVGGPVGDRPVTEWLDALEREFRYVVYAGDAQDAGWTDRCARQADCLLFVAPGGTSPGPAVAEIVRRSAQAPATRELLLLHPAPHTPPRHTARWLDATGARVHYHVREGIAADIERLARLLTGRGVGVALGGGGARGFAHIGVIQALRDAGIPIDAIGGTSMGAVLAAQYAGGADSSAMRVLNRDHWIRRNPLKDRTLPVVALLKGRRLDAMIDAMFGDTQIEDLWTTFFCVSADLTRAEMRVHARGPLGRAVRASMSLPGMAIPVQDAGSMLVDGGLMNNVPSDIMRGICGRVVAVDVSPEKDLAVDTPYPAAASGWRLLLGRKTTKLPGIGAILMRAVLLGSARHQASIARDVDLYLHPPVERFGMFEWGALDQLADTGYACARDALASGAAALR